MKIERRQNFRVNTEFEIEFGSEDEFISSYCLDLGQGGLFLKTDSPFAKGDNFVVKFNLPQAKQTIEAKVEVRWSRKLGSVNDGIGVRFESMNRGDYLKISTYLDGLDLIPQPDKAI